MAKRERQNELKIYLSDDEQYILDQKENAKLRELAEDENQALYRATKFNQVDYAVEYGEFMYQAGS